MVNFDPLSEINAVFSALFPVLLGIVLLLFVMGLIFSLLGAKNSRFGKMFRLVVPMAFLMPLLLLSASPGSGAVTSTGSMSAVTLTIPSEIFVGSPVTIEARGLTSATDYIIFNTHDATPNPIIFTSSGTKAFLTTSFPSEGDLTFVLKIATYNGTAQATGETGDASVIVNLVDASTRLPIDSFLDFMVPLVIIGVVFAVVAGIIGSVGGIGGGAKDATQPVKRRRSKR